MTSINLDLPEYSEELFNPYRYKILYGGRGAAKSETVAKEFIIKSIQESELFLCGREFQNSIKESVHGLISSCIYKLGVEHLFTILNDEIKCTVSGSRFIFKGLRYNIESIKSIPGIKYLWIEEASTLSKASWKVIKPTIRENGSEIWCTFNPSDDDDVLYDEFVLNEAPDNALVIKVNYYDNPFFPDTLEQERLRDERTLDRGTYEHIWLGEILEISDAQVFKDKFFVEEFEPHKAWQPLHGLDWGFAQDPTCAIEVYSEGDALYIYREAYKVGLELEDTATFIKDLMPGIEKHVIRADSARPESVSHVKRRGLPMIKSVRKWSGSVHDGIEYIRSYKKVIIHPRCRNAVFEFKKYSFKTNQKTGDIINEVEDKNNHVIDAIRYALEPLISSGYTDWSKVL